MYFCKNNNNYILISGKYLKLNYYSNQFQIQPCPFFCSFLYIFSVSFLDTSAICRGVKTTFFPRLSLFEDEFKIRGVVEFKYSSSFLSSSKELL